VSRFFANFYHTSQIVIPAPQIVIAASQTVIAGSTRNPLASKHNIKFGNIAQIRGIADRVRNDSWGDIVFRLFVNISHIEFYAGKQMRNEN